MTTAEEDKAWDLIGEQLIALDNYTRRTRMMTVIVSGLVALVIVGYVLLFFNARKTDRTAREFARAQDVLIDSRIQSCHNNNDLARNAIDAADLHDEALATLLSPPEKRTPADQHDVDVALEALHDASVKGNPKVPCDPKSIAERLHIPIEEMIK